MNSKKKLIDRFFLLLFHFSEVGYPGNYRGGKEVEGKGKGKGPGWEAEEGGNWVDRKARRYG